MYFPLQYIIVLLIIIAVVWLGDIVIRYVYHKSRLLICSSKIPAVQYRRENGEEMVSLLDEENDVTVTENMEHDNSVVAMVDTQRPEAIDEVLIIAQAEETIEND